MQSRNQTAPVLLFNDECGVCRSIAGWVKKQVQAGSGTTSIMVRPIGQDPEELRALNQDLNIWDAYATIHLLMPDGSMKLAGEAVAEVLRNLPSTRWFVKWTASLFGASHHASPSPHFTSLPAKGIPPQAHHI